MSDTAVRHEGDTQCRPTQGSVTLRDTFCQSISPLLINIPDKHWTDLKGGKQPSDFIRWIKCLFSCFFLIVR